MAAPFDLNDDSVVVIIGTGAGGGTLANELAQKGVKTVIAGGRRPALPEDFINDEWESSFGQTGLDWTRAPHPATGGWRRTFPACRRGSSRPSAAPPCTGPAPSLRFQEHEWKASLTTYGDVPGRQPAGLADRRCRDGALVRQGRRQAGRHPHQRHSAACPATTTTR
jgi:cation diffusion facilitator CzcD-associated flavoprotein CzcO